MTPEERQMLAGLFDRIQSQAGGPRDADAEAFIADEVRRQPYAPYLLAQTVLVQQQGLTAANDRIQELEAQLRNSGGAQRQSSGSFLGDIGRSIFGGGGSQSSQQQPPQQQPPQQQRYQPAPQSYDQQRYAPAQPGYSQGGPQGGPWGQQAPQMQQRGGGGGSFLTGALGAAAGVAGGVLLADSMKGLFAGHSATAATMAGGDAVPNTMTQDQAAQDITQDQDQDQDEAQDAADNNDYADNSDWGGGDDNSSFDA